MQRLRYELEARSVKPNERILALQDEVAGLKLIAGMFLHFLLLLPLLWISMGSLARQGMSKADKCLDDYERHLREPSRKVKEDVEKEWKGKVEKLEESLNSKHIWACRLDENVRAVTAENKILKAVSWSFSSSSSSSERPSSFFSPFQ